MGILPEAMCNFLALLGWSPGGDREVMTAEEMIGYFSEDGLLAKASVFDVKKLEWMNGQHLARIPLESLVPRIVKALAAGGLASQADLDARAEWTSRLIDLLRVRARTIDDIVRQATPFLRETIEHDEQAMAKQWKDPAATRMLLAAARAVLASLGTWDAPALEASLRALAEAQGVGAGKLFQPLRVALTGVAESPGIFDVLMLIGRERSLARVDAALAHPRLAA
jgi:glutamyl-tRNA synthetase